MTFFAICWLAGQRDSSLASMEGTKSLNSLFFVWWYTEVFGEIFVFIKHFFAYITDLFSVKICLHTLFSPWRRDAISYEGLTIQDRFQVLILNITSRFVGAVIKIFTMATFVVVFIFCVVLFIFVFISYLLFPLILIGFAVWGIKIILLG